MSFLFILKRSLNRKQTVRYVVCQESKTNTNNLGFKIYSLSSIGCHLKVKHWIN